MAESIQSGIKKEGLSIEGLKENTNVTDKQLDTAVEEADLPELAACFDNTEDYVEKLQLSPGQQTDVLRTQTSLNSTQAGMKVALKYWRNRNPVEATFRALLLILLSLLKGDTVVRVCKYLLDKFSGEVVRLKPSHKRSSEPDTSLCPPHQDNLVLLKPRIIFYRNYLQSLYKTILSTSSTQWPPLPLTKVFKLAMIQKERIQRGRIDDEFTRLSITGKIDDILERKTPVTVKNIFTNCDHQRRFVLIEGAPGSGKSTLALHICQEWAEGKLFQEYDVVILVKLRDPLIREAETVADLLPRVNMAMAEEAETEIISLFGQGVLLVLDGWDELPSDLPSDSIIKKLIQPDMFRECPLHRSDTIITSRPSSSAELHPLVSSRVEVLGFTPHELEQYFRECLKGDTRAVQTLLERIRENPVVEGSCYLPLNAAIVVHVFLSCDHSLPPSNYNIFMEVVKNSLKRYLQERLGILTPVRNITSQDSLPSEIQTPVRHMCRLAFHGVKSNKLTFTESDLTALSISKDISENGLLQSVPSIVSDGHETYFCFLHLSIQELLAAVHISHMTPSKQISVFKALFGTPRFSAVLQFYTGITKLKISRPWLNKLPRILCPVPTSVYDLVRRIVQKEATNHSKQRVPKPLLVSLLSCLYEAEDSSLCVFVASLLHYFLDVSYTTLTPLDSISIGYFLSAVSTTACWSTFRVDLYGCSISDQECKFLVRGLRRCLNASSKVTSQLDVDTDYNNIKEEGIHHIADLLKNTSIVCMLNLSANPIGKGGLKSLCEALSTNTALKKLYLKKCSLTFSEENGLSLYRLLSTNTSIRLLDLSHNKITNCRHIAAGLSNNKTLRVLNLYGCSLTDERVDDLSGLNNYIRILDIRHNPITENGIRTLARRLISLSEMRILVISLPPEPSMYTVFGAVNELRRSNGLPTIRVYERWNQETEDYFSE